MKLGLLWVGRTRDSHLAAAIDRYIERIGRYVPVVVMEVKEERAADKRAENEARLKECRRIREKIPRGHEMVLMDGDGREISSEQLAGFLEDKLNSSSATRGLTFVVGGHLGVDEETKRMAHHTFALSRMTLTHEMARLVTVEQIYRGLSILRGARYHR